MMSEAKSWSMEVQLKQGLKAEKRFLEICHLSLTPHDKREWDFNSKCGKKVELKTDTYDLKKTENFFVEKWSVIQKEKLGGPWQSLEKGADTFIYSFDKSNTYFIFMDLPALVKRLDELVEDMGMVYIRNRGWTTGGYKVPREALADLYEEYTW